MQQGAVWRIVGVMREEDASVADAGDDGLRAYVRALRQGAHPTKPRISQRAFAPKVGLSERAWIDIETGDTKTIKASVFIRALAALGGTLEDANRIVRENMDADAGRALALRRLSGDAPADPLSLEGLLEIPEMTPLFAELLAFAPAQQRQAMQVLRVFLRGLAQDADRPPP